jgi:hypothetical protein
MADLGGERETVVSRGHFGAKNNIRWCVYSTIQYVIWRVVEDLKVCVQGGSGRVVG